MHSLSIRELAHGLKDKSFSSVELTTHFLERIQTHDKTLNGFITVCEDEALTQAKAADDAIASGNSHPLTGIPIAHKDIFCTKQIRTTCGSKMLSDFIPPYESTVTQRCLEQHMPTLGKVNMDEFAMGSSNETSFFGPASNPWNLEHVPGGSSGGSAASVAARLTPFATGTDTGGSVRQPASFCGVTGIKPTYGRVSRWGMIAFASSLDQAGLLASSAEDCCDLLELIAGHDSKDGTSSNAIVPHYAAHLDQPLKGQTLGLPKQFFNDHLNPEIKSLLDDVIKQFTSLGVEIKEVDLTHTDSAIPAYYVIAPAECSSNLARYDGVRFGHRCDKPQDLEDLYKRSRAEGFGEEVKRRILMGTYTLCTGYYDAYYRQAQRIRHLIQQDFLNAFKEVDLIFAPSTPTTAFRFNEKNQDPLSMYLSDIYTISVNLAGLPAISLPGGFSHHMPVGFQLIGPGFSEAKLLNFGHQFQQLTDWHQQIPEAYVN